MSSQKKTRSIKPPNYKNNPITGHSIDTDMEFIRSYAKEYSKIPEETQNALLIYIPKNKSLDYYYGTYVSFYQMFTIAMTARNDLAPSIQLFIFVSCHRIVEHLDEAKKEIENAANEFSDIKPR